jgi:regulator of protease activity HflC (stomatin/prohibitin superfamily)
MTFGEFLAAIGEHIYGYWPFRIVSDWEQGVRVRNGRAVSLLTSKNGLFRTGLHLFWPAVGEIIISETNVEVNRTEMQTHTTKDDVTVTFALTLKYRIRDLRAMYVQIHDHDDTIVAEVCASAGRWIAELDYDDAQGELPDCIFKDVCERMEDWGIDVQDISLFSFTSARAMRLIMGSDG